MPDKYKKDISIEVLVGLFMFIVLIALGVFTIVLSRQNFLQKKYPIKVVFTEVGGLREGDHVFLRGTQVGVVKSTHLEDNVVVVQADLDVPTNFREGYKVEVMASSMLGGKLLKIYEGPQGTPVLPPSAVILGEKPIDILEELGVAVSGIKGMAEDVAAGEGTLGKLIKDDEMYEELKGTMKNLHLVSDRLANGEGTLGKLLSEDDQLYQDVQASAANIRSITEKIDAGGGTIGRLVEDDQIYVEAQKLLEELRAAIDDMRETSPVTTFSTIFFGAF
ncbi:MAG: MCE family protein [Verrucomicrobia bacterium]|nr:MCE family protein [Verrucomicrobiota bacterium]